MAPRQLYISHREQKTRPIKLDPTSRRFVPRTNALCKFNLRETGYEPDEKKRKDGEMGNEILRSMIFFCSTRYPRRVR